MKVRDKNFTIFIESSEIIKKVKSLSEQISRDYEGKNPLFIVVLKGGFIFASDLFKHVSGPAEVTFVRLASYEGTQSTGKINTLLELTENIEGRHVVIVEDIIDTGLTMQMLLERLRRDKPASVEIASFLVKPEALTVKLDIKYVCFEIESRFVVGYGLDYEGHGRNSADLFVLDSNN